MQEQQTTNQKRAAAFFRQPVWSRIMNSIYQKYIKQGRIGGQIVLTSCTSEEQREIARFLNRRFSSDPTLTVRLGDFQQALNASGFPCSLPELLLALYPDRSHITKREQRALHLESQQHFSQHLSALIDAQPAGTTVHRWLFSGARGRDYLLQRYKNETPATQEKLLLSIPTIFAALNNLPTPPAYERISLYAQRISGDPHALDLEHLSGRLFLHALRDLAASVQLGTTIDVNLAGEEALPTPERGHQRYQLYSTFGLLPDTISSTAAVFHLAHAEDPAEQLDPLIEQAGSRILTLPLRQLLAWSKLTPATEHIYLIENPQVFEVIIDDLLLRASATPSHLLPTLICTSGWPSAATILLLSLLTKTVPGITLHYSGDFDPPGLRIAAYLQALYPDNCQLWRLDASSYFAAMHHNSSLLSTNDLASLKTLPPSFASLVEAIQAQRRIAYQEGIAHLLLEDILHSSSSK